MERLIATWTLTEDLGAGFEAGVRIKTYWDDFAQEYVVKKDVPTGVLGSNLSEFGDAGTFEASAGTWGGIGSYLTRSSAQAQTGTYSGLYTQPDATNSLIATQTAELESGKTYRISCYVYVPSSGQFNGSSTAIIRIVPSGLATSNEVRIIASEGYDSWVQVSIDVAVTGGTNNYDFQLKAFKTTFTPTGICYIDQFLVREVQESTLSESTITTGPDLGQVNINYVTGYSDVNSKWFTSAYQFCSGTTLIQFRGILFNPPFPYVNQISTPNAPSCATEIIVCDLEIIGNPTIIKCSNPYSSDGEIAVDAQSGRGIVRFSLSDDIFSAMTNTSGVFSDLPVGTYTIYARDSANCRDTITVTLTAEETNEGQPTDPTPTYGVMYRLENTDIQSGVEVRVDILERNFTGDYTEVKGGDVPFLRSLGEPSITNKFETIRATSAVIQLASERDLQYIGLFSQDDRKYLVNYYKPVGTLKWRGYVTPSQFSEPYQSSPYITEIGVTDNVKQLEALEFLDKDGNRLKGKMSLIKIVALILNKLSLQLQINVGMNITEDTQNSISALEETQHDTSAFYDDRPWDCARVLTALLSPFGAKLVQENGVWNIIRVEEQCAQYNTRLYNREGDYISSSTYDPVLEIVDPTLRLNSVFRDNDQVLEIVPAYGRVTIVRKLFRKDNLLVNGSFDTEKFDDGSIEGWTINGDVSYKISNVIKDITTDFQAAPLIEQVAKSFRNPTPIFTQRYYNIPTNIDSALEITELTDQYVDVNSNAIPIEFTNSDYIIFSFNYRVNFSTGDGPQDLRGNRPPEWIRIAYFIKVGSYYFNQIIGWTSDENKKWNFTYVEDYDKDQKYEVQIRLKGDSTIRVASLLCGFRFFGANYNDFTNTITLADIVTDDTLPDGYRVRGSNNATLFTDVFTADYYLDPGTDATSSPDIIRPDDFHSTNNPVVWRLSWTKKINETYKNIDKLLLYDVGVKFLPNGDEAPPEEVIELVNNENYKENLIVELESGDVTELFVNNKKYLYSNIFLDPVGEPTSSWTRFNVGGTNTLQRLLLASLVNQYKFPTFKLSGSVLGFDDINFLTTFKQTIEQPSYSLTNGGFTGNITGWSNYPSNGSLIAWSYGSNSARVTLSGSESSRALRQTNASSTIPFTAGDRIKVSFDLERTSSSGSRFDWLEIKIYNSSNEVLQSLVVAEMSGDGQWVRTVRFNLIQDAVNISFGVRNIEGTGSAQYDMNSFEISGLSVVRYFTVNGLESDHYNNRHSANLMQLIPITPSVDADVDDSGEGNTGTEGGAGGGTSGSGSSTGGDFNNDFNADFYI